MYIVHFINGTVTVSGVGRKSQGGEQIWQNSEGSWFSLGSGDLSGGGGNFKYTRLRGRATVTI